MNGELIRIAKRRALIKYQRANSGNWLGCASSENRTASPQRRRFRETSAASWNAPRRVVLGTVPPRTLEMTCHLWLCVSGRERYVDGETRRRRARIQPPHGASPRRSLTGITNNEKNCDERISWLLLVFLYFMYVFRLTFSPILFVSRKETSLASDSHINDSFQ